MMLNLSYDELVLRPANCPHHALVYAAGRHSYRDLPIRLNELAPMFRAERSGVLAGLSRVRQINLDDTHVFCRPDQVADEAARAEAAFYGLKLDLQVQDGRGHEEPSPPCSWTSTSPNASTSPMTPPTAHDSPPS